MNYLTTGNDAVDSIGRMNISGNVVPQIWYKTILGDTGKPHYLAIAILADLVYWYRPTEIRDERSGQIIGWKKKFRDDILQRTYQSFSVMFGESEKTIMRAITVLENLGVVKRHRRTLYLNSGIKANNVLYLEIIPQKLSDLTFPTTELIDSANSFDTEEKIRNCGTDLSCSADRPEKVISEEMMAEQGISGIEKEIQKENGWEVRKIAGCGTDLSSCSDRNSSYIRQNGESIDTNLFAVTARFDQTNTKNNTKTSDREDIHQIYPSKDGMMEVEAYADIIRENINYDFHIQNYNWVEAGMFEELYQVICDIVCIQRKTVRINGEDYPYQLVKSKFLKLKEEHLEYVIDSMKKTNSKVTNIRAYMMTALYNAPNTIDHYYQQEVQHDLYG